MAKMDNQLNFKADDRLADWIGKATVTLDCSLSELIRASLMLSVPTIKKNPILLKVLSLDKTESQ